MHCVQMYPCILVLFLRRFMDLVDVSFSLSPVARITSLLNTITFFSSTHWLRVIQTLDIFGYPLHGLLRQFQPRTNSGCILRYTKKNRLSVLDYPSTSINCKCGIVFSHINIDCNKIYLG